MMDNFLTATMKAAGLALLISVLMGPLVIPALTRLKAGQSIREDGPRRHLSKAGTPTMGGIIIITAVLFSSLLIAGQSLEVVTCVLVTVAFGAIGFWDDYIKVVLKRSLGLRAREKLGLQLLIGLVFGLILLVMLGRGTEIVVPFVKWSFDLGPLFYLFFLIVVLMGTANGVNLTDGLDGLAAGATIPVALGFVVICIMTSHFELAVFAGALAGACLGFLLFNRYPARVFMGDTGSMALGGAVAAMAAITRSEIALIILGGLYVIETLSVIIQVVSYQLTGRRVFLMAPLHHHFELRGWPEVKVVLVFWMVSLSFVLIGLLGFKNLG